MFSLIFVLLLFALLITILASIGKAPLWPAVLLLVVTLLIGRFPR